MANYKIENIIEWHLDNGLKVLIKHTPAPVFTCQLWFKVGSIDEPEGLSGSAHLIEHMLFRSTKNFKAGEISKTLRKLGGIDNAATSYDYTYYWVLLGPEYLDFSLKIMSERFYPLFLEEELKKEVGVVLSELEGYENRPTTPLSELMAQTAYTRSPYKRPIIGYREDLENIDRDQLYKFYKDYYVPNNATLILVGDIDIEKSKEYIEKYFGKIEKGTVPKRIYAKEPKQKGLKEVSVSMEGSTPIVYFAYHIPNIHHDDFDSLIMLSSIIGDGKTSRLNQNLVETSKASNVFAFPFTRKYDSLFLIGAVGTENSTEEELKNNLFEEINKIKNNPVTNEELQSAINKNKADIIYETDSVSGLGNALGIADVYGNWQDYNDQIPRLLNVTCDSIAKVIDKYFTSNNLTVVKTNLQGSKEYVDIENKEPKNFVPYKNNDINLNLYKKNEISRYVLSNGIVLLVSENPTFPTVAIEGYIKHGDMYENINKPGISKLMANMLTRGTKTRNSLEIAKSLDNVGAYIDYDVICEKFTFSAKALSEYTDLLLYNLSDTIINPIFSNEEIEKLRTEALSYMLYNKQIPNKVANQSFYNNVVQKNQPFYLADFDESIEYTKKFTQKDVLEFYAGLKPSDMVISIVGDVDSNEVKDLCEKYFSCWSNNIICPIIEESKYNIPNELIKKNIYMENMSESSVIYGYPINMKRQHEDFYKFKLANQILGGGGALSSRFGEEIRENRGLVYGISSSFNGTAYNGIWKTSFGTNGKYVDEALNCVFNIMNDFSNTVTKEELNDSRNFILGIFAKSLETNEGLASALSQIEYSHLGLDYIDKIKDYYSLVTINDIKEMGEKYIYPNKGLVVICGDYK